MHQELVRRSVDPAGIEIGAILEILVANEPTQRLTRRRRQAHFVRPLVITESAGELKQFHQDRPGELEAVFGRARAEVQLVQLEQLRQARDRIRVVIDAIVDPAVVVAGIAAALAYDEQRRTLPSASIAPGPIAGDQCRQEAVAQVRVRRNVGLRHRLDDLWSGQDVALDGDAVAGPPAGPRLTLGPGESGGAAGGIDEPRLALLTAGVVVQESLQRLRRRFAGGHTLQPFRTVRSVGVRLSRNGPGAGTGPGDDGAHRRELGGLGGWGGGGGSRRGGWSGLGGASPRMVASSTTTWRTSGREGISYITSSSTFSMIERRPRAPVSRAIARSAAASSAAGVNSSLTWSNWNRRSYCRTSALRGSVRIERSAARSSGSTLTVTGRRPTRSGISP